MTLLILSLFCAFFIYMLDYGLGKPADDQPVYGSLLFRFSFFLARKALGKDYTPLLQQYRDQLLDATTRTQKAALRRSFQEVVFMQGRQLFTWQKIVGMCPICTHFWFTFIAFILENIFFLKENIIILQVLFYFTLSHVIIRILKRWI